LISRYSCSRTEDHGDCLLWEIAVLSLCLQTVSYQSLTRCIVARDLHLTIIIHKPRSSCCACMCTPGVSKPRCHKTPSRGIQYTQQQHHWACTQCDLCQAKRSVLLSVYFPSLLGNRSVNTFPRQRRIGDVFYPVRVTSNKSRRSVFLQKFLC
jgi:hypothetical protein